MLNPQRQSIPSTQGASPRPVRAVAARDDFALALEGGEATLALEGGEATLARPEVMPPAPETNQSWRWMLIALLTCCATSAAAVGAFLWLINLPPTANCENTASVTTDRAQLYCAQTAAESGELVDVLAGLDLVGGWDANHPLYQEVQPLVEQWSWVVLKAAEQELRTSSLEAATNLVQRIPPASPVHGEAQKSLQAWNTDWQQGAAIMAKAQAALQKKDWPTASQQILALSELKNPHWRVEQVQTLSRQIRQERRGQELLTQAIATATPGGVDQLGAAIRTASQIDQTTYARQQIQPYLDRWSDLLLKLGLDQWYGANLTEAIAMGRYAALNPNRAKAAQELIWLSQSRQMAQQSLGTWRTSPDQLMQLYKAMLVANQLPKNSPYYPQAQSSVATWRTHLEDLGQLQGAQLVGQFKTLDTLNAAIAQASHVPLGHPRRVQAQTMMAHWRQEIERIEDRPYLVKAHQLAKTKTIDSLQAAIQSAQAVALNRALRGEAQSWIYVWTSQIQTIEDQPILDRARALATRGELSQAMVEASTVKQGRALYDEAQAAIVGWRQTIWAQEQARRRALQRAAEERQKAAEAARQAEDLESTGEGEAPGVLDLAPAPAPLTQSDDLSPVLPGPRLRRSPLPERLETIPGPPPGTGIGGASPLPIQPVVPKPAAPFNAPPAGSGASTPQPLPLAPIPNVAPMPEPPTMPAPPPVDSAPAGAKATGTEAARALADQMPLISARPQPERAFRPQPSSEIEVLFTGALYAAR
ncbi:MAG: hypothetical protein ACFCVD_18590 [Nodosilinea sp.]